MEDTYVVGLVAAGLVGIGLLREYVKSRQIQEDEDYSRSRWNGGGHSPRDGNTGELEREVEVKILDSDGS